jgi:hypothetical protein
LAQIKLLQGAANAYHIETLPRFTHWFDSVEVLDERECFDLSCEIEPNNSGSKSSQKAEQVFYFLSFFLQFYGFVSHETYQFLVIFAPCNNY